MKASFSVTHHSVATSLDHHPSTGTLHVTSWSSRTPGPLSPNGSDQSCPAAGMLSPVREKLSTLRLWRDQHHFDWVAFKNPNVSRGLVDVAPNVHSAAEDQLWGLDLEQACHHYKSHPDVEVDVGLQVVSS